MNQYELLITSGLKLSGKKSGKSAIEVMAKMSSCPNMMLQCYFMDSSSIKSISANHFSMKTHSTIDII